MAQEIRVALLGATRGLGLATLHFLLKNRSNQNSNEKFMVISRQKNFDYRPYATSPIEWAQADFSKTEEQTSAIESLKNFRPNRILYFGGGGPYGPFESKEWKDHLWALEVTFLFPARLLHCWLGGTISPSWELPHQIVFIGSQVAENRGDPFAASYAAGKHALKGLIESVLGEKPDRDIRLFSPSYLDTELLPKNAAPRLKGVPIMPPDTAAAILAEWLENPSGPRHFVLS